MYVHILCFREQGFQMIVLFIFSAFYVNGNSEIGIDICGIIIIVIVTI